MNNAKRNYLKEIVESKIFSNGILILIIVNAISLGIETFPLSATAEKSLQIFNYVCTGIFIVEIILKIIVFKKGFFREGWNIFDAIIIGLSLMSEISFFSAARTLRIFRIFRALRVIRVIPRIKELQNVIHAMMRALPSIGWTMCLLFIVYYIYAIIGTNLFAAQAPEYFGNLWRTLYTLFQLTMADDLGNVTRPIMAQYSFASFYFISFTVIAVIVLLNLVIGVIVDSIEETKKEKTMEARENVAEDIDVIIEGMEDQLRKLKDLAKEKKEPPNSSKLKMGKNDMT